MKTTFLGIDPGFHITGYSLVKKEARKSSIIDYGYLKMSSKKTLSERVLLFYNFFKEKIETFSISHLVLETPFLGKNAQTFLKLGYLRGILYLLASQHRLTITEFSPREVKQSITGFGGASKEQVAAAMMQLFPHLREIAKVAKNDVTDAMAICICGLWKRQLGSVER